MARVTMKDGMLNIVTMNPEKRPTDPHKTIPARQASVIARVEACSPPPGPRMSSVVTTADSAMRLPTDKSMPPVMMTMVIPAAMMAMTAI